MSNLEKFGKLLTENLRDSSLNRCLAIEAGSIRSKGCLELSEELNTFTNSQLNTVKKLITECIDAGIHDFLFAIAESEDELPILVNGDKITEESDGLQGEIYTEDGWFEKYSSHGEGGI